MILITGGSGFVGVNLADRLLRDGEDVLILDMLSKKKHTMSRLEQLSWRLGTECW